MTDKRMTDAEWRYLHSFLSTCPDIRVGQETHCRLFVDAARGMARSGTTWRRLPPAYGKWNSVYRRLAHWCARGVWAHLMAYLQAKPEPKPELSAGLLDSTVGRAHARAAGAPKKKGLDPALGRGRPLCLRLTGGQCHDSTQARALVEAWTGAPLPCLIADRAYDGDAFRAWRAQRGTEAVIPSRKGRTNPRPHNPERYKARNAVERGIGWLKHGRRVATRYDKHAHHFLGFLYLAGAWIWLKSHIHRTASRISISLRTSARMAPMTRYPMAPHPRFAGYWFWHTRGPGSAWPSLEGADGRSLMPAAGRVREMGTRSIAGPRLRTYMQADPDLSAGY